MNKLDDGYERVKDDSYIFGVNEWCPLMKWRRLEEKKQELYLRDVETTGYKTLESKGEVAWGVTADSWC